MKKFLVLLFIVNLAHANELSEYSWTQDGLNARLNKVMTYTNRQNMNAILNIEFRVQEKCKDAFISVLLVKDKKLSAKKSHDFKKADGDNRLNFFINGKEFLYTSEKTIRVIYENGVEFGTIPSFNLIEELSRNKGEIDVKMGGATLVRFEKTVGLVQALSSAKKFCISKL
jgi:hypothetical protein